MIRNALEEIDIFRTPECLDSILIGLLAESKLSGEERRRTEEHLLSCLYCWRQLNDMKAMLYYRKHPTTLSPELAERLKALYLDRQSCDE